MPLMDPFSTLSTQIPIAFFPVRLETRYVKTNGQWDLLVRVFPDVLQVDTFEPRLTVSEIVLGRQFWEFQWRAGTDETRMRAAWQTLTDRLGTHRALYVATQLRPLNPTDRPSMKVDPPAKLTPPPSFPNRPTVTDAITFAGKPGFLPECWIVIGHGASGRIIGPVCGNSIPRDLSLTLQGDAQTVGNLVPDWFTDVNKAIEKGMAVRIPLGSSAFPIKRLFVLGGQGPGSAPEAAGADALQTMFEHHLFSQETSYIAPDMPTNIPAGTSNTGTDDSFNTLQGLLGKTIASGTYGADLAWAFGMKEGSSFTKLPLANQVNLSRVRIEGQPADATASSSMTVQHLHTILWPATWGYFLEQLVPTAFTALKHEEVTAWARNHFRFWVRPGGPLPTVRVGKQPYGVVPCTSLGRYVPNPDQSAGDIAIEIQCVWLLRQLFQKCWLPASANVPHIASGRNIDQEFSQLLGMEAYTKDYFGRVAFGSEYTAHLWSYLGTNADAQVNIEALPPEWWDKRKEAAKQVFRQIGVPDTTEVRAAGFVYSPQRFVLTAHLIDTNVIFAWPAYYLSFLVKANNRFTTVDDIRKWEFPPNPITEQPGSPTILYALARHAALLTYLQAADRLRNPTNRDKWEKERWKEPELVGIGLFTDRLTVWDRNASVAQQLENRKAHPNPSDLLLRDFDEFWESCTSLSANLPLHDLERCLRQALDACSHRLDAWVTSLASKRLSQLRAKKPQGLYLGCYGYVENLSPIPLGTSGTPSPTNAGYIHAPSVNHALTAAVLRSTYSTHRQLGDEDVFAVNLSSERVTGAKQILDGVRQGQPLGALLGYQFERWLHETDSSLGQYIQPFRAQYGLVNQGTVPAPNATENVQASVIDGFRLYVAQRANTIPWGQKGLPSRPATDSLLATVFRRLDDVVDSLSDVAITDAIYHLVQGNAARAGAALSGIAHGESAPPTLDSLLTPRQGMAITHRVCGLFREEIEASGTWAAPRLGLRHVLEPRVDAWLSDLLGDPKDYKCEVLCHRMDGTLRFEPDTVTLADLQLSASDLVYAKPGSGTAQRGELEEFVLHYLSKQHPELLAELSADDANKVTVTLNFGRKPGDTTMLSFTELQEVTRMIRSLLNRGRRLKPEDLRPGQDATAVDDYNLNELAQRINRCIDQLVRLIELFEQNTSDEGLLGAAYFGVGGALRLLNVPVEKRLATDIAAVAKELKRRRATLPTSSTPLTVDNLLAQCEVLFGRDFLVLPLFTPSTAADLIAGFANTALLDSPSEGISDRRRILTRWFERISRVRESMNNFMQIRLYTTALQRQTDYNFVVSQLPAQSGEKWAGLAPPAGQRLSIIAFGRPKTDLMSLDPKKQITGLVIDDWTETVPLKTIQTALTFHYEQSRAQAPQVVLLAVAPQVGGNWNLDTVEAIILETMDTAKVRMVDLEAMKDVAPLGQFLPAVYLGIGISAPNPQSATTKGNNTVSTDFSLLSTPC